MPVETPQSGYALERIYALRQVCEGAEATQNAQDATIRFNWDWRIAGPDLFEILLTAAIPATLERPERAELSIVGVFRVIGESQTVSVMDFVKLQGPAIVSPYLREGLSALTARGPFGPFHLLPLNIQVAMRNMLHEKSTAARQIEQGAPLPSGSPPAAEPSSLPE